MALSGSFNTNKYTTSSSGSIGLNLSWSAVQDITTNTTTISWTLKSNGSMSSGYSVYGGPITVTINGETVLNQTGRFRVYGGGSYKKTGTIVIQHEDDGTKSIGMSVRAALYSASVNCTGSANYELDPIPRFAYITSAPDFNDEANPTMTYLNPLGDVLTSVQACISVDGTTATIPYRDIDINGTSYTFNLTASERSALLSATPNSNTMQVYFVIKSVMNGETFYSRVQKVMSVVNANPTITNAEYYDSNPDTILVTQDRTKIIQSMSVVEFKFGTLSALKSATLASISITINGETKSVTLSQSTETNVIKEFGTLNVSSALPATIVLTDSRNNTVTQEFSINVLSWSVPTGAITIARINNFYSETKLKVQANYSSIDNRNEVTITYQAKKKIDSDYGAPVTIQNGVEYTIILDNLYDWDVKVRIQDLVGGATVYPLSVGKGIPIVFFDRNLRSMGINCFPTMENSLEIDNDVRIRDAAGNPRITLNIGSATDGDLGIYDQNGNRTIHFYGNYGGIIECGKLFSNGLSVSSKDYALNKTGGEWSVDSIITKRTGNIIFYKIVMQGSGTVNNGQNCFTGTLSGGSLPVIPSFTTSYDGTHILIMYIDTAGNVTIRKTGGGNMTFSGTCEFGGCFLVDD